MEHERGVVLTGRTRHERRARRLDRAREVFRSRHGRDIARVEELASGPLAVVRRLPEEVHGWEWILDEESGEIVSSYYNDRYRIHHHDARTRAFIHGWSIEGEGSEAAAEDEAK